MGKQFTNLKDLEKYIKKQVDDTLRNEVAEAVKIEMSNQVEEVVYDAYPNPKEYERRGLEFGSKGLGDIDSMYSSVSNGTLDVHNNAYPKVNDGNYNGLDDNFSLTENIVYGYQNRDQPWNEPRDFVSSTKEELERNKAHVKHMKMGLQDRGFDVV